MNSEALDLRKISTFLAIAFGLSWSAALVLYLAGIGFDSLLGVLLLVILFMWAPAIAAIVTQLQYGESIREGCGLTVGRLRWVAVGWLAPAVLIGVTIGVGTLLPGVTFTAEYGTYLLDLGLSEPEVEAALATVERFPVSPAVLFLLQGLVVGLTINAAAALGEELGWRGLLLDELAPLGFWKLSVLTGAVWGIWHTPIIVQGYNFPEAPLVGVAVMTAATIAMAPIYTYITVRARSVLAPTFFHGSFNGLGALSLVYLTGAGNLLIGPVGIAGIIAALLFTAVCVVHDRTIADEPITTGNPLSPWE